MLTFSQKFVFGSSLLDTIAPTTLGATILGEDQVEVAFDEDLRDLGYDGLDAAPISQRVALRVTARTEAERITWAHRIIAVAGPSTLTVGQQGYWQPTNEYEPSWLIVTGLPEPTDELWLVIHEWMVNCGQEAVYIEWGGVVRILDRDEVPAQVAVTA